MKVLLFVLLLTGCGETYCGRLCSKLRPQLVRDFGVSDASLNCWDAKFAIDDCPRCEQLFIKDYGVAFTPTCAQGGPTFIEPRF